MTIKPGFKLTDICGNHIIIAEGKENIDYSNIVSMNESSALLWNSVQGKNFTIEDLAKTLTDNYQLSDSKPLPYAQALKDAKDIAQKWIMAGLVEA